MILVLPVTPVAEDTRYGYVITSADHAPANHGSSAPVQLRELTRNKAVVVLVPAVMLSWHAVELPSGIGLGSPRLRAVLEGLLDDRLLGDIADLHLALAPAQASVASHRGVWVCACDALWLRGHINALEALGIAIARVVPECSPCDGPLQLNVFGAGYHLQTPQLLATGEAVGGVVRLPLSMAAIALLPQLDAAQTLLVYADPDTVDAARQVLPYQVNALPAQERWLHAVESTHWDLAQFDLVSTGKTRTFKRLSLAVTGLLAAPEWRIARWGLAVFLLANLAGLNFLAFKEKAALNAQRTALKAVLIQTFPHIKVVVDAPLQMEREWASLRQAAGVAAAQDIEAILSLLGQIKPAGKTPNSIEFANHEARIRGMQLTQQEMSQISAQLKAKGYSARTEDDAIFIKHDMELGASR